MFLAFEEKRRAEEEADEELRKIETDVEGEADEEQRRAEKPVDE